MSPIRRTTIRFRDLSDLRAHLDELAGQTLTTTGGWQAGQIFYHLAAVFEASSLPSRSGGRWPMRLTKLPQRLLVQHVGFPSGVQIPASVKDRLEPPEHVDEVEQMARLHRAIDVFEAKQEAFPGHPFFGPFNRREWRRFHLRHCELHLDHIAQST